MTEAYPAHSTRDVSRDHEGATPAFAIMALADGSGREPGGQAPFVRAGGAAQRNGHHVPAHGRVPFAASGLRLQIS